MTSELFNRKPSAGVQLAKQIDWQAKKAEFEAYLKEVAAGKIETLYDPRRMITSGPGFKRISATP